MIYAVNKLTKEHRCANASNTAGWTSPYCKWSVVEADADGWIPWEGGECPLPAGSKYQTKHESGSFFKGDSPESFGVHWRGDDRDAVIAYRPILDAKPSKPEAPEWDGGLPPVGVECEFNIANDAPEEWRRAVVVGHYAGRVVFCMPDHKYALSKDGFPRFFSNGESDDFRPIRSEEEKAAEVMSRIAEGDTPGFPTVDTIMRRLYRAGYRKVQP